MRIKQTAERYHDFCYGHRVVGHEGKCRNLHGHNGRVTFVVESGRGLDKVGRVIDFSVINTTMCQWLEKNWDHKMLIWSQDPQAVELLKIDPTVVILPFNPTAENLSEWLLTVIGPDELAGTGCRLAEVRFEETRKCSVTSSL
jgi:6-pyruvoyltetrahydropterin/6-carboxytetrahydropterin synthase